MWKKLKARARQIAWNECFEGRETGIDGWALNKAIVEQLEKMNARIKDLERKVKK